MSNPSANAPGTVLVVGAGPVGLTMAAHLHYHGLTCRIIERSPTPSDKSKALVLWGRTLEMLDDLGIVGNFIAAGKFLNAACLHGGARLLARIPFTTAGTEYPRPLMLAQSETERLLAEHLRSVSVAVERSIELTAFTDQGDHVLATLRHADGHEETIRCDWLIGCDGAHSIVRKQLGMEFTGEAEPNDWILADCRIEGPIAQEELSLFWHPRGVLAFFPFAADRCRVIADMGTAQAAGHPHEPSLAEVQRIVDERGPAGVRLSQPHWLSGFRINERKVVDYRRRRVFLAGDAAHIHSPAGGQGMNTGMQDTWNLAWKLALVQTGRARLSLLDSYSAERSAVGELVLRQASRMTRMAVLRNPVGQFFRNRLVSFLGHLPAFRRGFVRYLTEMSIHYPDGPLNGQSQAATWAAGSIAPGERMPDTKLCEEKTGQEQRLLSLLRGPQHNLLLYPTGSGTAAALAEIRDQIAAQYSGLIRVHLIQNGSSYLTEIGPFASAWRDIHGEVEQMLDARDTVLALVRPDGYLGYRGKPASWHELREYLDRYLIARTA